MNSKLVVLLLSCVVMQASFASEELPQQENPPTEFIQDTYKTLHVINNLSDICMLVEMPEIQLHALESVIKKAQVTINNTVLKDGQSTMITLNQEPLIMNIRLNGQAAQPFLRATGIAANFFFYLVQFEINFDVQLDDDQEELYTLNALVYKCDQWIQATPSITVSYRLPMTINVKITDLMHP